MVITWLDSTPTWISPETSDSMIAASRFLFIVGLLPLAWLTYAAWQDLLGANPIERAIRFCGDWALWWLLLTLSVRPLRRVPGLTELIRVRRMLGLFSFFYATLHVMGYVALDRYFDWESTVRDLLKRPYITVGALSFLLLLPLAITSTHGYMKRLGRYWGRLHRLVYISAAFTVVHYWLMVKADHLQPALHGVVLTMLLVWRIPAWKITMRNKTPPF
ncbi:MAG: sulfoxide reductase heme-binding subunit YedZ [Magnetococcales bacterium]|nr:sulfoxide reductase heme-binding subunit YedZ [Magnetococcales bacterium]